MIKICWLHLHTLTHRQTFDHQTESTHFHGDWSWQKKIQNNQWLVYYYNSVNFKNANCKTYELCQLLSLWFQDHVLCLCLTCARWVLLSIGAQHFSAEQCYNVLRDIWGFCFPDSKCHAGELNWSSRMRTCSYGEQRRHLANESRGLGPTPTLLTCSNRR